MSDPILSETDAGVALITLNRPERLNAMDREAGDLFERIIADRATDPAVKVIVITGAGDRGFCAGADMAQLQKLTDGSNDRREVRAPGLAGPLDALPNSPPEARTRYSAPLAVPQPVIAAINGACAGIGLSLAACCDIRFASRTAIFAAGFPRRGLTAEIAVAWTLSRIIGQGAASDVLLSGRRISADEALAMGLVNAVLEPDALLPHALAYARDIAENVSPLSTSVIKRQLRLAAEQSFAEAMKLSHEEVIASLAGEDFKEGVASFRERRAPHFVGR